MNALPVHRPSFRRTIAFTPVVLLVLFGVLCLVFYSYMHQSRDAVGRSREARLAAEEVVSDLKDIETGQRGYLLLADEAYLGPYHTGMTELARDTVRLRQLAAHTPEQRQRLRRLHEEIRTRVAIIDTSIALERSGKDIAAEEVVRSGRGRRHMDIIRGIIDEMDQAERVTLRAQVAAEERRAALLAIVFGVGVVLLAVSGYLANQSWLRYAIAREKWTKELAEQNEMLQNQSIEMELQQAELETQNEELTLLNEAMVVAKEQAEEANEAKNAFLMAMSHELRTPLNAIAGYTDLIEAGIYGPISDGLRDAARRIHLNEEQLLSIINQILHYTGLRSHNAPVPLTDVNVVEVLHSLDAIVAPLVAEKGVSYRFDPASRCGPLAHANADRLRQVLVNVVGNAVKFTHRGGTVELTCAERDSTVIIAVQDTGIGIEPHLVDRIFEPFVQVHSERSGPGRGGVGLGLAISRELLRTMGGEITVASTPGAGSTFTITLRSATRMTPEISLTQT